MIHIVKSTLHQSGRFLTEQGQPLHESTDRYFLPCFFVHKNIRTIHVKRKILKLIGIGNYTVRLAEAQLSNKFKWKIACFEMFITWIKSLNVVPDHLPRAIKFAT
jgi:hypothetical protein